MLATKMLHVFVILLIGIRFRVEGHFKPNHETKQEEEEGKPIGFAKFTLALASSICGVTEVYKKTKILAQPLIQVPEDLIFLEGCEEIVWRKCVGNDSNCLDTFEMARLSPECRRKNRRIIYGDGVDEGLPWDVNLRMIYDWGKMWTGDKDLMQKDRDKNTITGLKELYRCTGVIYSRQVILTSKGCAMEGRNVDHTGNRFVAWIARKSFRFLRFLIEKDEGGKRVKTADIIIPPDADQFYPIAIIKLVKELPLDGVLYAALELPPPATSFVDTIATYAGWGRKTFKNEGQGSQLHVSGVRVLQKFDMRVVEEGDEEEAGCVFDIRPNIPVTTEKRHLCAQSVKNRATELCLGDEGGALVCSKNLPELEPERRSGGVGGDERIEKANQSQRKYLCGLYTEKIEKDRCVKFTLNFDFYRPLHAKTWIESLVGRQVEKDLFRPQ